MHAVLWGGTMPTLSSGLSMTMCSSRIASHGSMQGVAKAKRAWKERNAVPITAKAAKDMRPTGRGGFGTAQQQQGRGGAPPPGGMLPPSLQVVSRSNQPQCNHVTHQGAMLY